MSTVESNHCHFLLKTLERAGINASRQRHRGPTNPCEINTKCQMPQPTVIVSDHQQFPQAQRSVCLSRPKVSLLESVGKVRAGTLTLPVHLVCLAGY